MWWAVMILSAMQNFHKWHCLHLFWDISRFGAMKRYNQYKQVGTESEVAFELV